MFVLVRRGATVLDILSIQSYTPNAYKVFEARLAHLATHDPLTALPNRALLAAHLAEAGARGAQAGTPVALLALDLDDFKRVNDTWGHATGDAVLVAVARRLGGALRPGDTLARLGGEEFVASVVVGGHALAVGTSIGIAISMGGQGEAEELPRRADAALYRAKAAGKGRYVVADP